LDAASEATEDAIEAKLERLEATEVKADPDEATAKVWTFRGQQYVKTLMQKGFKLIFLTTTLCTYTHNSAVKVLSATSYYFVHDDHRSIRLHMYIQTF
jgi:hypothetical protein